MKNNYLVLLTLVTLSLVSCKKDDKDKGKLDPNSKITITGVHSLTKTDTNPAEIEGTGITDSLEYITKYAAEFSSDNILSGSFGWEHNYLNLRDIENNKLKFWGTSVVTEYNTLGDLVMKNLDIVVTVGRPHSNPTGAVVYPLTVGSGSTRTVPDTVGYIPNSVVLEARAKIVTAFEAGDYAACYKLFDEAYIFIPTTGPKWRAMQKAGNN